MNTTPRPIVVEQSYDASPEGLWSAITDPEKMPNWFFESITQFEPRVGFETRFTVHAAGRDYVHAWRVTKVVPSESLTYEWLYDGIDGHSTVCWEITDSGEYGTTLRLTHSGHETFPRDNPVFSRPASVAGWTYFLTQLKGFVEGPTHHHHAVDYFEIGAVDLDAAKAFYAQAFEWRFNEYGPQYVGIQKAGGVGEVGGIRLDSKTVPGGPLVILYSDRLEDSRDLVRAAGGEVIQDIFAFPGGRRFHFADPSGNELAVWGPPH